MSVLYTVFIYPLELLFEVVFTIAGRIVHHPGYAIIVLSLIVNLLLLPLYARADKLEKEQKIKKDSMAQQVKRIKEAFKGDERVMMLQAYYKENDYRSADVFKESVSLLLQIPFFMAAYRFLSHLELLRGVSFGPISDLGAPDHMCEVFGFGINVLPILMTLINVVSGIIYTKGMPVKSKIQLYGIAAVFLALLYDSPSGLVFYWTLNNIFSCVKNVFYKFKRPGFVLSVLCACIGVLAAVCLNTVYETPYQSRRIRLTVLALILVMPLVINLLMNKIDLRMSVRISKYGKHDRNIFLFGGLFMSVLTGLLIPSAVIKTSPYEFMDLMHLKTPIVYIIHAFLIALGYFVVWGGVFYALSSCKIRVILSRMWLVMCPVSLISYMFFGTDLGDISVNLVYILPFEFSGSQKLINMLLIVVAVCLILVLNRLFPKAIEMLMISFVLVTVCVSVVNMVPINKAYKVNLTRTQVEYPHITLSADGRNVLFIMIDRAPGYLVPFIFNELPYLEDEFDGFTFYPNTVSFGNYTKFAAGPLFGGYDYTPENVNADNTRTIVQKHNEALSVLPIIFRDEGYEVTLIDPPYAGYREPSDLSVFSGPLYEGISSYLAQGVLHDEYYKFEEYQEKIWLRNFFCYSVFKISPLFFQSTVYNEGQYNQPAEPVNYETDFTIPQIRFENSVSTGIDNHFMSAYEVLTNLDDITEVEDGDFDAFMYINNNTAHDPILLQEPDYIPQQYVNNSDYDAAHADRFDRSVNGYYLDMTNTLNIDHYVCNAAVYIQLGDYFNYLRECGVWDNTRIVIAADHAIPNSYARMFNGQTDLETVNMDSFNPVLMVKDFGSTGFTVCEDFMTNADVPYILTYGIVDSPVNPFTGNPLVMDHQMPLHIFDSADTVAGEGDYRFAEDHWYLFNGDRVFDMDSWEYDGIR